MQSPGMFSYANVGVQFPGGKCNEARVNICSHKVTGSCAEAHVHCVVMRHLH